MSDSLQRWTETFADIELPVLARTLAEIAKLRGNPDSVTNQKLTDLVMRDPLMTMKVLRYLQQHRSRRRTSDITTVGHALMMLGLEPFFNQFSELRTLESQLAQDATALHGAIHAIARSHRAALYAHDWARLRHDLDPDEIMTSTLLHDFAEIMLWCAAPGLLLDIAERMEADPAAHGEDVELEVLGFRILDLNLALITTWEMPELLLTLLDDRKTENPRALNVIHAVSLARHSARGWNNLALLHDLFVVGKLLGLRLHEVERRVMDVGQSAARDDGYYGVRGLPPQLILPRDFL